MSEGSSINILLDATYNETNIYKILLNGSQQAINYHFFDKPNEINPFSDALICTQKIFSNVQNQNAEFIHCVTYDQPNEDKFSNFIFFFHQDNNNLEFHIGAFGADCFKKNNHIDLSYYVPFFLKLCNDFAVIKITADLYED